MTRVSIPGPDIEADVSAEQLTAYAIKRTNYTREQLLAVFETYTPSNAERWIRARAKAEGRHPSAVLADIVGPAVGVAGANCALLGPWADEHPCGNDSSVCAREAQKESDTE